jgi:hypothetical protein
VVARKTNNLERELEQHRPEIERKPTAKTRAGVAHPVKDRLAASILGVGSGGLEGRGPAALLDPASFYNRINMLRINKARKALVCVQIRALLADFPAALIERFRDFPKNIQLTTFRLMCKYNVTTLHGRTIYN